MPDEFFADSCWSIAMDDPEWQEDSLTRGNAITHSGFPQANVNEHAAKATEEQVSALPLENAATPFHGHGQRLATGSASSCHNYDQISSTDLRLHTGPDDTFPVFLENGHRDPHLIISHDASQWGSSPSANDHACDFPDSSREDSVNYSIPMESIDFGPLATSIPDRSSIPQGGSASGQIFVPSYTPSPDGSTTRRTMPYGQLGSYTSEQLAQDLLLTGTSHSMDPNYAASVYQPNAIRGVMTDAVQNIDSWYNSFLPFFHDASPTGPRHELISSYPEPGAFFTDLPSGTVVEPHLESLTSYSCFRGLSTHSVLPAAASGAALQPTDRQGKRKIKPTITEGVEASYMSELDDSLALDFTAQRAVLHPDLSIAGLSSTAEHGQEDSNPHAIRFKSVNSTPRSKFEIIRYEGEDIGLKKRKLVVQIANQKPTKERILYGNTRKVQGSMLTLGRHKSVRAKFDEKSRLETALQRKVGNCERCRALKRKCDIAAKSPYESCTACISVGSYKNIPKMPCFRSNILDATFFSLAPITLSSFFTKRKQIFELSEFVALGDHVKSVDLTHYLGHSLTVYVSTFVPQSVDEMGGDITAHKCANSAGRHSLEIPPCHLTNLAQIRVNMRQYLRRTRDLFLSLLKPMDGLTWNTIQRAISFAASRRDSMVERALNLWVACRTIDRSWEVCDEETVGILTKEISWRGMSPINPIMQTQLDQIVIRDTLNPLRMDILQELSHKIEANKPEFWLEIYLTIFTLLNSIEVASAENHLVAKRWGRPTRFADMKLVEGWFHTCKILLSRFHYVCGGSAPWRADWKKPATAKFARLNTDEVKFMEETKEEIIQNAGRATTLRLEHWYECNLYWCHQLFLENWDTGPPQIMPEKPSRTQWRKTIVLREVTPFYEVTL